MKIVSNLKFSVSDTQKVSSRESLDLQNNSIDPDALMD